MELHLFELTGKLENVIRRSISGLSAHEWNEDFITFNLFKEIRNELFGLRIVDRDRDEKRKINWEVYKLKGTHESKFGDVALVINIDYRDGTSINGVAFLEAKKRDWRKTTFGAMKLPQAKRILKNAPRSQYLLYDYEEITNFLNSNLYLEELRSYHFRRGSKIPSIPVTRAVCVPLNLAVARSSRDTSLYRYGTPLSEMLSDRYFQGLDLEFDETSKKVATGYLEKFGLPKIVMKIDIVELSTDGGEKYLQINEEKYEQID